MNAAVMSRHTALVGLSCLAVLAIGVWLYWPGTYGPELLDDRSSVQVIGDLKGDPDRALDYVLGDSSGLFGRSVSMASFVLERLYLEDGLVSSKRVNVVLHAVNGGLLMWLLALLFRHVGVPGYRWLAVLLGAAWLLHPLLVSTVLYVVQRMAMLATFFMLAASLCYVGWRLSLIRGRGGLLRFLPVPALLFVGLLAKENAVVLVPVLILMEVLWFRFEGPGGVELPWLKRLCYGLILFGVAAVALLGLFSGDYLQRGFAGRPFSLSERLLTESRILWDYVGQWFMPEVFRMGIYHDDVILSRSLTDPPTTLYAVLGWCLVAVASALLLRWPAGRWAVFGIAWFLLGHSVESTVLPLELYFEHRNYFPAIGLLITVGAVFAALTRRWPEPAAPILAGLALLVLVQSALTSSQVQLWSDRTLLVFSHMNGHPQSPRANTDMAVMMATLGQVDAALEYSRRAYEFSDSGAAIRERQGDYEVRNLALRCMARAPVEKAQIAALGRTDPDRPLSSVTTLLTTVRLLQDNHCPEFDREAFADRLAEMFLVEDYQHRASPNIYSNLAVLENALGRYDKAYAYIQRYLALAPGSTRGMLMKLHFATALGNDEAVGEVVDTLGELQRQGRLTVGEQKTLALYLEN